jgi:hypothetical protein
MMLGGDEFMSRRAWDDKDERGFWACGQVGKREMEVNKTVNKIPSKIPVSRRNALRSSIHLNTFAIKIFR